MDEARTWRWELYVSACFCLAGTYCLANYWPRGWGPVFWLGLFVGGFNLACLSLVLSPRGRRTAALVWLLGNGLGALIAAWWFMKTFLAVY